MVALVIMDGVTNDVDDTVDKLVEYGELPLSIIIAGVGPADFGCMVCVNYSLVIVLCRIRIEFIVKCCLVCFLCHDQNAQFTIIESKILCEVLFIESCLFVCTCFCVCLFVSVSLSFYVLTLFFTPGRAVQFSTQVPEIT